MTVQVQRRRNGWRLSVGIGNDAETALRDVADLEAIHTAAKEKRLQRQKMNDLASKAREARREARSTPEEVEKRAKDRAKLSLLVTHYLTQNPGHSCRTVARNLWRKNPTLAKTAEALRKKIGQLKN